MEQYIQPLWIVIFLFLVLTVLFILSKLMIIRTKLKTIKHYSEQIAALYAEPELDDSSDEALDE